MGGDDDTLTMSTDFNPTTKAALSSGYTNGIIWLGNGSDTLNVVSGVVLNGSINAGADSYPDHGLADGDDIVNINGTAQLTGNLNLGSGVDTLNLSDSASIGGYVTFDYGNDVFDYDFSSPTRIDGYILMGGGDDTLAMSTDFNPTTKAALSSGYTNGIISLGTGSDTLNVASGVVLNGSINTRTGVAPGQ